MSDGVRVRQAQRIEQLEATLLAFAGFVEATSDQLSPLARGHGETLLRRSAKLLPSGNPSDVELVAAASECDGECE